MTKFLDKKMTFGVSMLCRICDNADQSWYICDECASKLKDANETQEDEETK